MTDERIEMLNKVGFVWEVNIWNERFEELKQFHAQFDHFLVPAGKCFSYTHSATPENIYL